MVVKIAGLGRSFAGVAAYCLHDRREPGEPQPESAERVEWTETRNLPTSRGDRAAAIMAATAEAAPELKRLAGASAVGRRLEKPVCHYSLSWAKDQYEVTDRQEMQRAVAESLTTLGLEKHQALIVAHGDGHPHVHVIVNRVDPESGKAATLSRSKLRLSKWAQSYEQGNGFIRCERRVANNARRARGERVRDRVSVSTARHRRERMNPHQVPRQKFAAGRAGRERERVAWRRAEERVRWIQLERGRGVELRNLERWTRREWADLYGRQGQQRKQLAKDGRRVLGAWGRLQRGRRQGKGFLGSAGAVIGSPKVLRRWAAELEQKHRCERVELARAHFGEVRVIEREAGDAYQSGMAGSEARAARAASEGPWHGARHYADLSGDGHALRNVRAYEELEQVREVEGEAAYQRLRQSFESLRQSPLPSKRPTPRGPERGGGIER